MRAMICIAGLLASTMVMAGVPDSSPIADPVSVSTADSHAGALAASAALSGSVSGAQATGTGGQASASATGGDGKGVGIGIGAAGDSASSVGDTSSEANGTQAMHNTTVYERQVPALIMGTVIPNECGFGGQAGGANTSGAGFLGASWTTDRCYTLKVANAWAAMGEYEYACEMLMDVSRRAMKRRGIVFVGCKVVGERLRMQHEIRSEPVVIREQAQTDLSAYATKEYVDRAFRSSVSK